jgi:tetratricopeptide (TPR) repeat protein
MADDNTLVVDLDEEKLVRHFCLEAECEEVIKWFGKEGYSRPSDFKGRLSLAAKLREKGNQQFQEEKWDSAMMHALSALHVLDFSKGAGMSHSDAQKKETFEALVRTLSNLSIVFLKRGDNYNTARAADLGLDFAKRHPGPETDQLRAKLLYRRGLAKGQQRSFEDAKADLLEAARLQPDSREIRKALENCKVLMVRERGEPDDKWRGKLTESPEFAVRQAQIRRCWRNTKAVSLEVWFLLRRPETLRTVGMLLVGPLLSYFALEATRRWSDGKMPPEDPR